MYDRLMETVAGRPQARIVWVEEGQIEQAYQALLGAIG
jgi:hypothetical protein